MKELVLMSLTGGALGCLLLVTWVRLGRAEDRLALQREQLNSIEASLDHTRTQLELIAANSHWHATDEEIEAWWKQHSPTPPKFTSNAVPTVFSPPRSKS